jgi:hypothetical protein
MQVQTIVHCCCSHHKLNGQTGLFTLYRLLVRIHFLILNSSLTKNFGGFIMADISFWDMCASGGAINSGSVVVCETFASPDAFASGGAFNSVSVVVWVTLACPDNALS